MSLQLFLFGNPRCEVNGRPQHIQRRKSLALLTYLAQTGQAYSRENIAALFWPELDRSRALRNLSRDLNRLKTEVGEGSLLIDRKTVQLELAAVAVDTQAFAAQLALVEAHGHFPAQACADCLLALETAVALYKADFMSGFTLPNCLQFDDWQFFEREALRQAQIRALQQLIEWHTSQKTYGAGIAYGRLWLALDPLNELTHRSLMHLYAQAGQQAAAQRQYQECVRLLADELGVEPEPETRQLYQAIQTRQIIVSKTQAVWQQKTDVPPAQPEASTRPVPIRHNLPASVDQFVGRVTELAHIRSLLTQGNGRLLTVLGPGGIGKSRLALEAARLLYKEQYFADGVFFVDLAGVDMVTFLMPTIADTLGYPLSKADNPLRQLAEVIGRQQILLILDNFEQLQPAAAQLSQLLEQCPHLTLLVTSRRLLKLLGEYTLALAGLPLADPSAGAGHLFVERAQQVVDTFDVVGERPFIQQICQLVGGLPLAIEMAAAWVVMLNCREIVAEIQHSLELLEASIRDVPERHRSMEAVFKSSWAMLTSAEKDCLSSLAVFRGGFTREAAQQVAGATPIMLRALLGKSFISSATVSTDRSPDQSKVSTRYRIHELLRQFTLQLMDEAELDMARSHHCRYFAKLVQQMSKQRGTNQDLPAIQGVFGEIDNLRGAWQWLARQAKVGQQSALLGQAVGQMLPMLLHVYYRLAYATEGQQFIQILGQATRQAGWSESDDGEQQLAQARLSAANGRLAYELSQFADALNYSQQALPILRQQDDQHWYSLALATCGMACLRTGEIELAQIHLQASIEAAPTDFARAEPLKWLGILYSNQGHYEQASGYYERSLAIYQARGYLSGIANLKMNIGAVNGRQDEFELAIAHYEQALLMARESKDRLRIIGVSNNIAYCLHQIGQRERARKHYREGLALAQETGRLRWQAVILQSLGEILLEEQNYEVAEYHLRQGLDLAITMNMRPEVMSGVGSLAHWYAQKGQFLLALQVVGFVAGQEIARKDTRRGAQALWDELASELPPDLVERAKSAVTDLDYDRLVAMVQGA